jgi:hypothetical protein
MLKACTAYRCNTTTKQKQLNSLNNKEEKDSILFKEIPGIGREFAF